MKTVNKKVSHYIIEQNVRYVNGELSVKDVQNNTLKYSMFFNTPLSPSMFFPVDLNDNPLECTEETLEEFNKQLNENVWFNVADVKTYGDNEVMWCEIVLDDESRFDFSCGIFTPNLDFQDYLDMELKTIEDLFDYLGEFTLTNAGEKALGL